MRQIILCLLLLCPTVASAFTTDSQEDICIQSWVLFCDNFENRSLGLVTSTLNLGTVPAQFKNPGWNTIPGDTTASVVNSEFFDGTKAVQQTYFINNSAQGMSQYMSQSGLPNQPNLYLRFYIKKSLNWVWSGNGEKMVFIGTPTHDASILWDHGSVNAGDGSGTQPAMDGQFGLTAGWFGPNLENYHFPLNEWVCLEAHWQMNTTAGGFNGLFEYWVKDSTHPIETKVAYWPNINIDDTDTTIAKTKYDGYWNCMGGENPPCTSLPGHPEMYRWLDNWVVATQRIGCLGAAPPDTTPPSAPTGVIVTMLAAAMIFGGLYGSLTANRVPVHRLALGHDSADSATLRTVAVHGSASGVDAVYAVPVADWARDAQAIVLDAPAPPAAADHQAEARD